MGYFKELNIAISDMVCSAVITHFAQWWNVEGSGIEKIRLIDQQNWELDEEEAMNINILDTHRPWHDIEQFTFELSLFSQLRVLIIDTPFTIQPLSLTLPKKKE
ncbi:hypothetical protein BKA93DRAFT_825645 [Sparassis latifolia]